MSADVPPDESSSGRRPYETPRIIDLGTVADVTRGLHLGHTHDALGTSLV